MKRTVPLLITAVVGTVLIASRFIPAAESWGESAAIWFDILAAVAFVLGGGNLLKLQLRKISDRKPGWGYAAVTLIAFLVMLASGLGKIGSQPAEQQEFYGQSFAPLAVPVAKYVRAVLLIGADAPAIRAALENTGVELVDCASLEAAVKQAAAMAQSGDEVLLSPACASFDMFDNYAHRAKVFVEAVRELALDNGEVA